MGEAAASLVHHRTQDFGLIEGQTALGTGGQAASGTRNLICGGLLVTCFVVSACIAGDGPPWTQLSLSTCKVDAYRQANPQHDGRGIVVAVLDTGVDMGVAGLTKTPGGEVKVIDAQDFTGQGDVKIERANWNEANDRIVHYADDGAPELFTPPAAEHLPAGRTVWFGLLEEKAFKNSSVPDINDDGDPDDVFGVCVVSDDGGSDDDAVCFVDTDGDRDFADEKALANYKLRFDAFTFAREKKEKQIEPLTCALNVFVKQRKVAIHFDDGGHGTHVAGIAAGHAIQGQAGFDGVAPGAKLVSLKIGHNTLAGGSTVTGSKKKAFEYAARYAREHDVTVVCNLSYGIGSDREGQSEIDKFLDELLHENPGLVVCTSAGNNGPGLSSIGTPAAASAAISAAALIAADTGRDVRGEAISAPQLTQFSSRGGELAKPDLATPGMMTSTVPKWNERGDFYQGTSMASPYAAGLCAILAQRIREGGAIPRADVIKQALLASAAPMAGYTALDYGGGIPDLPKAAELVDALAKARQGDPLYELEIETPCPLGADGQGDAAYWRGDYFPDDVAQVFTITPVFAPTTDARDVNTFSKRLTLGSDADWCRAEQEQIYLRSRQSAQVHVRYDRAKLQRPGLYVATIEGLDEGRPLVRLVSSIVVPHRVDAASNYRRFLESETVRGWVARRHFVEVPSGASAMHLTLRAVGDKPSTAQMYGIFGPDGRVVGHRLPVRLDTRNGINESTHTVSKELTPGVFELPVTCARAEEESAYSLEVRFDGIQVETPVLDDLSSPAGKKPSGKIAITNVFDRPRTVETDGLLEGYRKTEEKKLSPDEDTAEIALKLTREIRGVRVRVEVSDEDYAKFTDCALNIYDAKGKAIAQSGLSAPIGTISADNPEPSAETVDCKLEIRPAFTHPNIEDEAAFDVRVDYLYADAIPIAVTQGESTTVTLYPGVLTKLSYELKRRPPEAPKGTRRIGYVRAMERATKEPAAEIEILEGAGQKKED